MTTKLELETQPADAAAMAAEITEVHDGNADAAAGLVDALRELSEKITAHYEPIISAQREALDQARAVRDEQVKLLDDAQDYLRGLLGDFARKMLAARAADGDTGKGVAEGTTARVTWTWRAENPLLVPREFLCLDEKAIGALVRAKGDAHGIPGIVATQEVGVTIKRRGRKPKDPGARPREFAAAPVPGVVLFQGGAE